MGNIYCRKGLTLKECIEMFGCDKECTKCDCWVKYPVIKVANVNISETWNGLGAGG